MNRASESGMAIFEGAALLALLVAFLLSTFSFVDWFRLNNQVNHSLDKVLYDSGVKSYRFQAIPGSIGLVRNDTELTQYVQTLSAALEGEIEELLGTRAEGEGDYLINVVLAEAQVDTLGRIEGQPSMFLLESAGTLQPSQALLAETDLQNVLNDIALRSGPNADSSVLVPTLIGAGGGPEFMDRVVLVAARVLVTLENGFTGRMISSVREPVVARAKAIAVRGEIEL